MLTLYEKEILKTPYADINFEGAESKLKIICSDRPEKKLHWITWLIDHGAHDNNAHPKSMTALSTIIERSVAKKKAKKSLHTIAEILLQKSGSDPSKHIHAAIDARDPDIVQLLIRHGATIKKYDYEWFHDYLAKGDIDENALGFLLDRGYDPYKHGDRFDGTAYFGIHYHQLDNAIQTVARLEPSAKRDRILSLMQQYPKKGPAGADSN
jgi:hypothetical protein